jgi:hypothetical protein
MMCFCSTVSLESTSYLRCRPKCYTLTKTFLRVVKGKGKVAPVLNYALHQEDVLGEWRYSSTHSLTSAIGGGEWSASCPGRFTPRERAPGNHWIGGWAVPRAGLNAVVEIKIPSRCRDSNSPIIQPVAQRYTTKLSQLLFEISKWN